MIQVNVPGDKSISHRALIFAALADGESRIRRILLSDDIESTASVLRSLGVAVPVLGDDIRVQGVGLRGLSESRSDLDCGNSGTTLRLLTGVAAALPFVSRFVGDASLSRRPMRRLAAVLERMGASFDFDSDDGLPMSVVGARLSSIDFLNEKSSAQMKSAVLLAGLVAGVPVSTTEKRLSRDHTENMLASLGAAISRSENTVTLQSTTRIDPLDIEVPGDPSSAAFVAAWSALSPGKSVRVVGVGLNPTRIGFFSVLRSMGAQVDMVQRGTMAGEPYGDVTVAAAELRGVRIGADQVPAMLDELPLVAVLAAHAEGETVVTGAGELRVKESDRIAAVVGNLRSIGVEASELPDGFVVSGSHRHLAGKVAVHSDHRIAMAFGVLGAVDGNAIEIDDPSAASISFPNFWRLLEQMAAAESQS